MIIKFVEDKFCHIFITSFTKIGRKKKELSRVTIKKKKGCYLTVEATT